MYILDVSGRVDFFVTTTRMLENLTSIEKQHGFVIRELELPLKQTGFVKMFSLPLVYNAKGDVSGTVPSGGGGVPLRPPPVWCVKVTTQSRRDTDT